MALWLNAVMLLMLLTGFYCSFVTVNKPDSFGFKGASFYYYGRRIWKFTNRLFGFLLISGSLAFIIIDVKQGDFLTANEGTKQIGLRLIYVVLSFVTTDVLAFIIMSQKKKKRKIKQF